MLSLQASGNGSVAGEILVFMEVSLGEMRCRRSPEFGKSCSFFAARRKLCLTLPLEGNRRFTIFAQDRAGRLSDIVRIFPARRGTAAEIAQVLKVYLINSQFKFNLY